MADLFENHASKLESPFSNAADVVPSDSTDLPMIPRALYCTGIGNVRVTMRSGAIVTLPMLAGAPLPARVSRVWATGTTATGIVAVW